MLLQWAKQLFWSHEMPKYSHFNFFKRIQDDIWIKVEVICPHYLLKSKKVLINQIIIIQIIVFVS